MRRSSIIIVLMLSLFVPLQTAANTLAAALMCAQEQAALPAHITQDMDSDHSSMKCCPEKQYKENNQQQEKSDCRQMKCCQWCHANRITLTSISPMPACTNTSPVVSSELFSPLRVNPASVWRPPTAS